MRYLIVFLSIATTLSYADGYRCNDANGRVVMSSAPCPSGWAQQVVPTSNRVIDSYGNTVSSDLERQKEYLRKRQAEKAVQGSQTFINQAAYNDSEARRNLDSCLMQVSGVLGMLV